MVWKGQTKRATLGADAVEKVPKVSLRDRFQSYSDEVSRLLQERPVRNAALAFLAAGFFSVLGLLQALWGGTPLADGEVVPLLRNAVFGLFSRVNEGIGAVSSNPHAFPSSPDVLVLLGSIAFILPAISRLGMSSSVLANLLLGVIIGPSGFQIFQHTSWSQSLAQVGVLFFLCEMGLELNLERLKKTWREVFVVGLMQFALTTTAISIAARSVFSMTRLQAFVTGTALSLSSSAFVLQLLDERKERGTRHGRVAFGILLFQDLFVPLLLVLLPMLYDVSGPQAFVAIRQAFLRTGIALAVAVTSGRLFLNWIFSFVANARSPVALRSLCFFAIFCTCWLFEAFGLPPTLGAFLAGVLISETAYRQQVDAVISPVREDFFAVFFISVGFSLDLHLVFTQPVLVLSTVAGLLLMKSLVTAFVCHLSGLSFANSLQIGLLLSQAGEFSFVMISTATSLGSFGGMVDRFLATVVGITLASTPLFAGVGSSLAQFLETSKAAREQRMRAGPQEPDTSADVIVYGFGRIGRLITQVLDERLVRWIAFDSSPRVVNDARKRDLPVFYGDLYSMAKATINDSTINGVKMIVITLADSSTLRTVLLLRKRNPELQILACVMDLNDAKKLQKNRIIPLLPTLPEDSLLLNLPLGIAVLDKLGYSEEEIGPLIRDKRLELIREEEERGKVLQEEAGLGGVGASFNTVAQWYKKDFTQGQQQ